MEVDETLLSPVLQGQHVWSRPADSEVAKGEPEEQDGLHRWFVVQGTEGHLADFQLEQLDTGM